MKHGILMNSSLYSYWSSFFYRQWFWDAEITQNAWSVTVGWRGCFRSLFIWSCSTAIIIIFNVSGSFHYQSAGIIGCKFWLQGSGWAKRRSNDLVLLQELIRAMCHHPGQKHKPTTEGFCQLQHVLPWLCALTLPSAQRNEISSKGSIINNPGPGSVLLRGSKSFTATERKCWHLENTKREPGKKLDFSFP